MAGQDSPLSLSVPAFFGGLVAASIMKIAGYWRLMVDRKLHSTYRNKAQAIRAYGNFNRGRRK